MSKSLNRRAFLAGTAAAGAACTCPPRATPASRPPTTSSASASSASAAAASSTSTSSCKMQKEGKAVEPVAVCDVWDGDRPSWATARAAACTPRPSGAGSTQDDKEHVTKDYRKILDQKDVDVVVHRHARPLARQDVHRRHGRRQGRLLREADDPDDRRGASRSSMPAQKHEQGR